MDYKSFPKEQNCILGFAVKIPGTTSIALWYSQLLSNIVQNQRMHLDFYLWQPRLSLVTNGGLLAIGMDQYHIHQWVGDPWSPLIQIATDIGSCWEKTEFRLQIFKVLVPEFGSGFSCLVPANTNTLIW